MNIQIKKPRDGRPVLVCVRKDGSRTWSRLQPFFPVHDLTHCAVESVLGFTGAFFGLVQQGWEIDRFNDKERRAGMPTEAMWAECIVGLFDQERSGKPLTGAAFTETLATILERLGVPPFRAVTDQELQQVRALRDELAGRWWALPEGETLTVPFPAALTPA